MQPVRNDQDRGKRHLAAIAISLLFNGQQESHMIVVETFDEN